VLTKAGTTDNNSGREEGGGGTDWHKRRLKVTERREGTSKGWFVLSALTVEVWLVVPTCISLLSAISSALVRLCCICPDDWMASCGTATKCYSGI